MKLFLLALFSFFVSWTAMAGTAVATMPTEKLIDDLTQIDAQTPGLHGTAMVVGFIAEDKPLQFGGGVLGSTEPKVFPPMRELVRRGMQALPDLIKHLDDKRPTKLQIGGDFFMFCYFSDEYDPRKRSLDTAKRSEQHLEKSFRGLYTVKVGDVCYVLIGQIVNRGLAAVRYQPTAGLVVNSPIEAPDLIERVKNDWVSVSPTDHEASLISDAESGDQAWVIGPALTRLRFYYPEAYRRLQQGELKKQIARFENAEKPPK